MPLTMKVYQVFDREPRNCRQTTRHDGTDTYLLERRLGNMMSSITQN